MDRSTCRGCGAEILWGVTEAGKRVPLDPEEHAGVDAKQPTGPFTGNPQVVTGYDEHGKVRTILKVPFGNGGVWLTVRTAHFSSCPKSNEFRRRFR